MQDYSIAKCTRRCALSGRALEPNESYFSVIVPAGEDVSRLDIAASHWNGPVEGAIGWWRSHMPAAATQALRPAPTGVLLDTLGELLQRPGKEALAYVLALLLVRRRVLQEEQGVTDQDSPTEPTRATANEEVCPTIWPLVSPTDGRQWQVPVVSPSAEQLSALQAELKQLLFTDQ